MRNVLTRETKKIDLFTINRIGPTTITRSTSIREDRATEESAFFTCDKSPSLERISPIFLDSKK